MILDSSALVAMLTHEPEAHAFNQAVIDADVVSLSAANYLETAILLDRHANGSAGPALDRYLHEVDVQVRPVTWQQVRSAREAHRRYGRGSGHPATLNFGDCLSYALAKERDEP